MAGHAMRPTGAGEEQEATDMLAQHVVSLRLRSASWLVVRSPVHARFPSSVARVMRQKAVLLSLRRCG